MGTSTLSTSTKTSTVKTKSKQKQKLFRIGILVPLTTANHCGCLCQAAEMACDLGFEVSLLAEGDQRSQQYCFDLSEKYENHFSVLESSKKNHEKIVKESDIIVFAKKPKKSLFNELLAENKPMVLPEGCGLENFNPQKEAGEAFTFEEGNFWHMAAAIIRASENKKFKYDWNVLKKNLAKV